MAFRSTISQQQREILLKKIAEGMQGCSSSTLTMRQAKPLQLKQAYIGISTINVSKLNRADYGQHCNRSKDLVNCKLMASLLLVSRADYGQHCIEHWINNHKKRSNESHRTPSTSTKSTSSANTLSKRKRLREPSGYNAFSKEFHNKKFSDLNLSEKSKLMAETWRAMTEEDKEKYRQTCTSPDLDSELDESGELSITEKKKLTLRVVKRHQGDANMLQSLGCEVASMMFVDGQVVTIGTPKEKNFLQTHPAIISSFNFYFLYDDFSNKNQSVPTMSSTQLKSPPSTSNSKSHDIVQTSTASSAKAPVISNRATTASSASVVLLKGKDGSVVAKGTVLLGRDTIHGHPCKEDCRVVTVTEVVQVSAQPWFEDRFDKGLSKGGFVE